MKIQKLSSDELNTVRGGAKSAKPTSIPTLIPSTSFNSIHSSSGTHNYTFIWG